MNRLNEEIKAAIRERLIHANTKIVRGDEECLSHTIEGPNFKCEVGQTAALEPVCSESESRFVHHWQNRFHELSAQSVLVQLSGVQMEEAANSRPIVVKLDGVSLIKKTWGEPTAIVRSPAPLAGIICREMGSIWVGCRTFNSSHLRNWRVRPEYSDINKESEFIRNYLPQPFWADYQAHYSNGS